MRGRLTYLSEVVLTAGLLFLIVPNASHATDAAAFLGRWDITISQMRDTFRSSWLEVKEGEGKLSGKLLWKWGSVTAVRSVEVVENELRVTRREWYEDKPVDVVYKAKLVDGRLVGSVKNPDGAVLHFTGIRSVEKVDVSGTWQLTAETPRRTFTATLVLDQQNGQVTGKCTTPANREFPLQNGKLEGAKLSFSIPFERPGRAVTAVNCSAEVRDDRLLGTVQPEGRDRTLRFTARRQRKWGEPIQLFNGKDLTGWGPRDAARGFHWSVKDGVMINRPPDQDILSERQFQDFKLHVEFSLAKRSNSGVYLRGRYELQLVDDYGRPPGKHSNCSIYSRLAPSANASKRPNEWQTLDATLVGRWLTVVLNGQTVMDNVHLDGITGGAIIPKGALCNNEADPGPLMFQGDHGLVRYRKIVVTPALD